MNQISYLSNVQDYDKPDIEIKIVELDSKNYKVPVHLKKVVQSMLTGTAILGFAFSLNPAFPTINPITYNNSIGNTYYDADIGQTIENFNTRKKRENSGESFVTVSVLGDGAYSYIIEDGLVNGLIESSSEEVMRMKKINLSGEFISKIEYAGKLKKNKRSEDFENSEIRCKNVTPAKQFTAPVAYVGRMSKKPRI